ncbi:MAG TPA: ABC transporter transmembrane domain-containing protein, partial [Aggregatilineales bacterium]|nr:ABC transporter transmembrane domain-containing protein [Aggregatilineales bacterium]
MSSIATTEERTRETPTTPELSAITVTIRILHYVRPYMAYLVIGFFGIIATQVLAIIIPEVLRHVIDRGVTQQDRDYMFQSGLIVIGLGILRGLAGFLSRYATEAQSHYAAYDIRNKLYEKVQRLPFSYHDTARTGSLITRGISDVDEVQRFLAFGLIDGLNTVMIVTFASVVMFTIHPLLAAITLLPLVPLVYGSIRFASFVDREWRKVMERLSNLGDHLQENLVGAEVVRAFARENHEIKRFREENERLYNQNIYVIHGWTNYIPFSAIMISISTALTLIFGALLERQTGSGVTIGVIVQFNYYVLLMAFPIRFFGFAIMLVNQGISSARRVFEIIDTPESLQDSPDAYTLPEIEGVVRFENVSLQYNDDLPETLYNIDIEAHPDEVIALIGKTGSGKTS